MKHSTGFLILCVVAVTLLSVWIGRGIGISEGRLLGYEEADNQNREMVFARAKATVDLALKYDLRTCETWLFAAEKKVNRITQDGIVAWKKECK